MNITEEEKLTKKWCLYCHTNIVNNKKYFGITCQKPEKRWQNGNGYKTKYFYNAIQKYGWDGFKHEIIKNNLSFEDANNLEKEYIKKYHTCIYDDECWGYNSTFGGDGCYGYKHSDETKEKFKQRVMSDETKEKISKSVSLVNKGHVVSDETKEKIREKTTGRKLSEETKKKISEKQIGRKLSEEWKKHISEQHLNNPRYNCVEIFQKDKDGIIINKFPSISEARRQTGINNISACLSGKQKTAGGYIWECS